MTTTAPPRPRTSDVTGPVVMEAARRMLPALTARVLAAATDRVLEKVDQLADRLDDVADNGLPQRAPRGSEATSGPQGGGGAGGAGAGPLGAAFSLVVTQARAFLDLVVQLLARAAAALRTTADRARRKQAPEGTDEERAALDADENDDADETRPTAS